MRTIASLLQRRLCAGYVSRAAEQIDVALIAPCRVDSEICLMREAFQQNELDSTPGEHSRGFVICQPHAAATFGVLRKRGTGDHVSCQ